MSRGEREGEETLPAGERADAKAGGDPTRSLGVSRPRRYGLASRMEKAQVVAALFDEPVEEVRVGRFVLREYVGGGGMGEVYAAWDERAQRKVALKMVRADHATSARPNDRLLREAQVLAQLSDPNVVHLYEVDEIDGRVFLAMELVHGRSLRRWLNELDVSGSRARVREVLRRFVAAGRGLKAAHEAGLVHRDFKPDNVLVGDDGRVRVVDFGLARPVARLVSAAAPDRSGPAGDTRWDGETLPSDGSDRGPGGGSDAGRRPQPRTADRVLTSYGQILGTPPYMSPEQLRGAEADHRSDQFSFCVALYEALYGEPPFAGASFFARQQAIERGLPEPPRGSAVPAPVRKAIQRGLAADPAARFPDMGALLDVLERWLHPRRLARAVVAAVMGTAVAGCTLLYVFRPDPCSDAGAEVAELWAPARREAIREAFKGTGLSYAAASFSTLEHGIGSYARRLEEDVVSSCEATRVQETQSAELMDLRALCLDSRQRRLDALLEQLEHADASMVERAVLAAAELPDLATCQHAGTLLHGMPRPAPGLEARVAEIRDHLAQARTQELLGKRDEALRIARAELEQAQALAYGPVQAEALYQTGRVLVYRATPGEREEGEAMLLRAANLAESERHDELVADAWNFLVLSADRNHSSTERARQWHERADTAIRRIGDPPLRRAAALRSLARIHLKEGELDTAEAAQRKALALIESAPDASRLDLPAYQHDLSIIMQQRDRHQEARELLDRALAHYIAELGETHPHVASVRYSIAMLHMARGDSALARQLLEDLLGVHNETLGTAHLLVGNAHVTLADIHLRAGALARAHQHATQGLDIYQRVYGTEHAKVAAAYARLGAIEFRRGAHERALSAYETSLTINTRHLGESHVLVGYDHMNIAEAKLALGRHDEALVEIERAERILRQSLTNNPSLAPFLASVRGRVYLGKGALDAAVTTLDDAVRGLDALPGDSMLMERADAGWALVQALSKSGRADDPRALGLAHKALATYEQQSREVDTPRHEVQRWLEAHDGR
jgi:serine/threonine protein kinase/tetratricopeptide (TPR) repeat protein